MTNLFKRICLFLKIFFVTLLRITIDPQKQGVIFVMRLASTPQYKAKIHKILFSSVDCGNPIGKLYLNKYPDSSRAGAVQFINLKSYDEDCLLRQCFTISTTTNKTVTQTQVKPFCLSKVDSFLSFMILTVFPHGYRKWFPCRLSPPYSLWL